MLARRLLTITFVSVALPALLFTAPFWILGAAVVDTASRLRRFPTVRLGLFGLIYLIHEWVGLTIAAILWLRQALFGRRWDRTRSTEPYRKVQAWWASSLLEWAGRLMGLRFVLADPSGLPTEPFILLSRHASMIDAILPVNMVTKQLQRFAHYVLKSELRWVPNLDVYGHRLGNYFVARSRDAASEAQGISRLAAEALPGSVLVIFPEGTYATPATRRRVITSLERRGDQRLVDYARSLDHLLPPKPAGTLALLAEQPTHDVVVLGHFGLEGVAHLRGLRRRLPLEHPVVVDWWHHRRGELPTDDEGKIAWLNDRWRTLDAWVGSVADRREQRRADRPTTNEHEDGKA